MLKASLPKPSGPLRHHADAGDAISAPILRQPDAVHEPHAIVEPSSRASSHQHREVGPRP